MRTMPFQQFVHNVTLCFLLFCFTNACQMVETIFFAHRVFKSILATASTNLCITGGLLSFLSSNVVCIVLMRNTHILTVPCVPTICYMSG